MLTYIPFYSPLVELSFKHREVKRDMILEQENKVGVT